MAPLVGTSALFSALSRFDALVAPEGPDLGGADHDHAVADDGGAGIAHLVAGSDGISLQRSSRLRPGNITFDGLWTFSVIQAPWSLSDQQSPSSAMLLRGFWLSAPLDQVETLCRAVSDLQRLHWCVSSVEATAFSQEQMALRDALNQRSAQGRTAAAARALNC